MIPSWLAIALVTLLVIFAGNRLTANDIRWFNRLRRPRWLTFEVAIPFIWITIFICGAWSSYVVWEITPGLAKTWQLMGLYLLLEIVTISYTPVMCKLKSLRVGTVIGATGFLISIILAFLVFPISTWAGFLLLPYIIWSPIGTYTTWAMIALNPEDG
ncbi:MAG TPA: TspO protein [Cyanobacteria bacterium UBA11149]|nr:TspO protein [Cyanobacteria bacterium UBA11367]HBE60470.1 TspO protein [Cyanobacteria bacterium UBA11366]HBR74008.1 TspO protein [Cyanobacteria bacterium UBA11159]HBS72083.1 TspO protein [Cyanobacteria bacterium UBA11153]HBW92213.1 TspO protein [Cyanobacteria bacterium UBA11149]HCA97124.1 TspO protein [Cyanobacteria bacterium UBA9226]